MLYYKRKDTMEATVGRFNEQIKQDPEEFKALAREIDKIKPNIIIEIGVLRGGIISYYKDKIEQVIGIDIGTHPKGLLRNYPDEVVIGNSHSGATYDEVKKRLNGKKADVLFIDGDHSAYGCKLDFTMYSQFVREGGMVAFHDILRGGWHEEATSKHGKEIRAGKVWNDLKHDYEYKELVNGDRWAGIGILYIPVEEDV